MWRVSTIGRLSGVTPPPKVGATRLEAASTRGTEVHALSEAVAHGISVDPDRHRQYMDGIRLWFAETRPVVLRTEFRVVSKRKNVTGRIDLLALIDRAPFIADWKSGSESKGHGVLLAGYEELVLEDPESRRLLKEHLGHVPLELGRLNIYVPGNRSYREKWRNDPNDRYVWRAALGLVQWQYEAGYITQVDPAYPPGERETDWSIPSIAL